MADPKDLNEQTPAAPEVRREKDEIAEEDLNKVVGGAVPVKPPLPPKP